MTPEQREELIEFCVGATADLNGVDIINVDRNYYSKMNDAELEKEADWLDDMLGK